ncbi:hypothetical protein R1sor_019091 [Riccia sorocarpa]|uniref:Uncharacterized protein n=1 Tax=Riccia sorocarpa TaxID=122646 RepID=A0ABD3IEV0_9MARC
MEDRSLLAGREFQELNLFLAGQKSHFLQPVEDDYMVTACSDRPLLVNVLKAFVSNTSKHKLLRIEDNEGDAYFFAEESVWDSVFSPLLYDESSLEAISVECYDIGMLNAIFTKIPHLLSSSSTLRTLCFGCSAALDHFHLSDAAVKALSEGLVKTKCLRTLVLKEGSLMPQFVDVLTSAFTGNAQNTSLEEIDLPADLERLGKYFWIFRSVRAMCAFQVEEEQRLVTCWDKWLSANDGALLLGMRLELMNFPSETGCPIWMHEIVRRSTQLALTWWYPNTLDVMSWPSEVFRSLMDLLEVNIYLEEIDLGSHQSADSDGRNVLVQEALRRNKEQSANFAT